MFVHAEQPLAASFAAASARLAALASDGGFGEVSRQVYHGGVAYLMRVGPAGPVSGASWLVWVQFTDPAYRDGQVTVGIRWETSGVKGGLFPALDADIQLTAAAGHGARVALTGSYRPPLGVLGAELDRLLLRAVATATIRTVFSRVAGVLDGAPAEASRPLPAWWPGPGLEPAPG